VADLRGAARSDWARPEDGEAEHRPPFGGADYASRGGAYREEQASWERRREDWPGRSGGPGPSNAGWPDRERAPAAAGGLQRGAYGYGTSAHGGQDARRGASDDRPAMQPRPQLGGESYDFPVPHGMRADAAAQGHYSAAPGSYGAADDRAAYDAEVARAAVEQERAREARHRSEHPALDEVALQRLQPSGAGRPVTPDRPLRVLSRSNVGDVSASIRAATAVPGDAASAAHEPAHDGDAADGLDERAAEAAAAEAERGRLAKRSAEAEAARAAAAAEEERRKAAALAKLRELEERQAAKAAESAAATAASAAVVAAADAATTFAPAPLQHAAQDAMSWRSDLAAPPRAAAAQWGPPGAAVGGFSGKPAASISPLFSVQALPEEPSQRMRRLGLGGADEAVGGAPAHLQSSQLGAQHGGFWSDSHGALGMPSLSAYPLAHETHGAYAPVSTTHAGFSMPQFSQLAAGLDADGLDSSESPAAESERRKRGGRRVREADERRASRAAAGSSLAAPAPLGRGAARKDLPRPREGDANSSASDSGEYGFQRGAAVPMPAATAFRNPQQQLPPVLQRGRGGRAGDVDAALPALPAVGASVLSSTWGGNVWAPPQPTASGARPSPGSSADDALLLSRVLPPDLALDAASYAPPRRPAVPYASYGSSAAAGSASTWGPSVTSAGLDSTFFSSSAAAPSGSGNGGLFGSSFAGAGVGVSAPYVSGTQYGQLAGVYGGSMWAPPDNNAPASAPRAGMSIFTNAAASLTPLPSLPLELGGGDDGFAGSSSELSPAAAAFNAGGQRGYVQHRGRGHRGRGAAGVVGNRASQAADAGLMAAPLAAAGTSESRRRGRGRGVQGQQQHSAGGAAKSRAPNAGAP
jgi:hypothetical protein